MPIFRLPQTGFFVRRVASFHPGAANSRQLRTDKFNLHLQYCMSGVSAYFTACVRPVSAFDSVATARFSGHFPGPSLPLGESGLDL